MQTAPFTGVVEQVARSIRSHRAARGLSLGELARRSGLSKAGLAKLEAGGASPSLESLWRIAGALDLSLGTLLGEGEAPSMLVVRAGEGTPVESESGLTGRVLVSEGRNHRTEVLEFALAAEAEYEARPHAPGTEELVVCIGGALEVGPLGREVELRERDALRFPADVAHRYRSDAGATALLVMSYAPALHD